MRAFVAILLNLVMVSHFSLGCCVHCHCAAAMVGETHECCSEGSHEHDSCGRHDQRLAIDADSSVRCKSSPLIPPFRSSGPCRHGSCTGLLAPRTVFQGTTPNDFVYSFANLDSVLALIGEGGRFSAFISAHNAGPQGFLQAQRFLN